MNIIFLDIDGVLNSEEWYVCSPEYKASLQKAKDSYISYLMKDLDPRPCCVLNWLCDTTHSKLVLSSSWRWTSVRYRSKNEMIQEALKIRGCDKEIIGLTPRVQKDKWCRGDEIEDFIKEFEKHDVVDNYVILDDGIDFLPHQMDHVVRVDSLCGLTFKDAVVAFNIFHNRNVVS